ncbi:MAG TPA: SPOR domain-containing protein [Burkholderiales bacterium]|nr:SPOR domain-containing protein [Burkholderiales bacterium]
MRVLLLALLLANVAWFAWARFYGAQASPDAPLVSQQINRDAIKLLAPAQVASLAKPAACVEWGGIAAGDATRAEEALAPLALGDRLTERRSEESASWWVFVPALPTRQAAQQKAAELKRLGVEELFIIADEAKTRFPISLGVFRSEEAARSRLQELQARGVKTAQAGRRDTPFTRVYFQLRGLSDAQASKLNDIKQSFAGSEIRECAGGAATAEGPAAQPASAVPATQPPAAQAVTGQPAAKASPAKAAAKGSP